MSFIPLELKDADMAYFPNFFEKKEADNYFSLLLEKTEWQQDNITLFGKTYLQPRLTALYASNKLPYTYSNITMHPHVFYKELIYIKDKVEEACNSSFTTCLLNLYRNGQDSNGWHADDESELGVNPVIASVSLGAERIFHLKHKEDKTLKHKLILEHGSLLLMKGTTQHCWLHQLPKTKKQIEKRINLTFRILK